MIMKFVVLFLTAFALALTACGDGHNHEHDGDTGGNAGGEQAHGDQVPNNGAVVRILSPSDGATFAPDEQIIVEIAVENFSLGVDGNHWHVYLDGTSYGMIMGTSPEHVIRGVEPGVYTLTVRLADGDHRDLEEGDSVQITVRAD
jgi:hypothetical protein